MQIESEVEPIPFNQVTDQQVLEAYKRNPVVSNMCTWDEVKENETLFLSLKHQAAFAPVIDHKNKTAPVVPRSARKAEKPEPLTESAVHLSRSDVRAIRAVIALARNTLQSTSPGAFATTEAIKGLYHAKKIIDKKLLKARSQKEKKQ